MLLCNQVWTVQRCGPRLLLLVLDLLRVAAHSAVLGGGAADRGDPLISVRIIVHRQEKVAVRNLQVGSGAGEGRSAQERSPPSPRAGSLARAAEALRLRPRSHSARAGVANSTCTVKEKGLFVRSSADLTVPHCRRSMSWRRGGGWRVRGAGERRACCPPLGLCAPLSAAPSSPAFLRM